MILCVVCQRSLGLTAANSPRNLDICSLTSSCKGQWRLCSVYGDLQPGFVAAGEIQAGPEHSAVADWGPNRQIIRGSGQET